MTLLWKLKLVLFLRVQCWLLYAFVKFPIVRDSPFYFHWRHPLSPASCKTLTYNYCANRIQELQLLFTVCWTQLVPRNVFLPITSRAQSKRIGLSSFRPVTNEGQIWLKIEGTLILLFCTRLVIGRENVGRPRLSLLHCNNYIVNSGFYGAEGRVSYYPLEIERSKLQWCNWFSRILTDTPPNDYF